MPKRFLSQTLPRRVILQVTPRCNAQCRHCAYEGCVQLKGLLPLSLARRFLNAFAEHWGAPQRVGLTGGEPLLYPRRTLQLSEECAKRGCVVRLLTNAFWGHSRASALQIVKQLQAAGVAGLWISAGAFHAECIAAKCVSNAVAAAQAKGMKYYLNFTYLHPRGEALRARGLPEIDENIESDAKTLALQRQFAADHPEDSHGWARVWDLGRARALFDGLGHKRAAAARSDLKRAVKNGEGALLDLVGLSTKGEVFFREETIGTRLSGEFDTLLDRIYPRQVQDLDRQVGAVPEVALSSGPVEK